MANIESLDSLRRWIIKRAITRGLWSAASLYEENLIAGVPAHSKGEAKDALKSLIKEGIFVLKPHTHGIKVFLNKNRRKEIEELIK